MSGPAGSYRSPLARARGLGSAKEGVHHWLMQRVSSLLLVPLSVWFVASLVGLLGAEHATVTAWLSHPLSFGLMTLLLVTVFYHAQLGLQVVLEDYIANEGARIAAILLTKLACLALALAGLVALLVIAFGG